jgi:hypothetical protein
MTMSNLWTIENDPPPNPGVGNALNGLQIVPVLGGTPPVITGYQLVNGANVLASSSSTSMPVCFNSVSFASRTWDICASVPTVTVNGVGTWVITGQLSPEDVATGDNGEFTAQAGTGIDPEAASYAKA